MVGQGQQRVLICLFNVVEPLGGHAVAEQFIIGHSGEKKLLFGDMFRLRGKFGLHVNRDNDLLHRLANLDQLRSARFGMRLQFPPFRPVISIVVVVNVTKQKASIALVDDQPDVAVDPHRPEVLVLRLVELVEAHSGTGRIDLQVERGGLDGLLLVAGQPGEAVGECVRDAKFHLDGSPLVQRFLSYQGQSGGNGRHSGRFTGREAPDLGLGFVGGAFADARNARSELSGISTKTTLSESRSINRQRSRRQRSVCGAHARQSE